MNAVASLFTSINPYSEQDVGARARLSEIDRSARWPVLFFFVSGILWLLGGTALAIIASWKLHDPEFLADLPSLTFGVARSAHLNAMIYGWANNAGFALIIWMMARLCRIEVRFPTFILLAGILWNIGVTAGIIGIMAGDGTSVEWLEMPTYVAPVLALAYVMIGLWGVVSFRLRQTEHVYVTQWYLLGAIFWFPWLYSIAQIFILWEPARGTVQSLTNWWFAHNVLGLWLTPIGVGAAYYFIPKVLGRPIYSYYLSVLGFWALALFYNWAGVHHLIGGPVPAWVISAGVVGSVMMVIPVIVVAVNHHMTVVGSHKQTIASPTLRFVVFGAVSYTMVSLTGSAMALRSVNEVTHFTHFTVGHAHHGVYAFFTMILFGGIYYMMPRLLYREWPSALLIRIHFWFAAAGITLMLVALHAGGWIQGSMLNALTENGATRYDFLNDVVQATKPYLQARSLSGIMLTVAHLAFAVNFFWMLLGRGTRESGGPTLLVRDAAQS